MSDRPDALAVVDAALGAVDFNRRRAGMYALGVRGTAGAERLAEIARSSPSAEDRDYALMVLSYFAPTDSAVEVAITAAVRDRQSGVRINTREYLAFNLFAVAERDPRPRLRQLMREGGLRQRWRAFRALRRMQAHARLLERVRKHGDG